MQLLTDGKIVWEKTMDKDGTLVELEHDALVSYNGNIFWKADKEDYGPTLGLKAPKRLFDITTMKVVLYEDVVDVEKEGYVAISHVWGDQKNWTWYNGNEFGITWAVPLSDPDKLSKVRGAMSQYKKKYCWFDVLCMPQGEENQWQVNLEIPFMGDYYAGASMVLVLATVDPIVSDEFTRWYNMMNSVIEEKRDLTKEELDWIYSHDKSDLLDVSGEKWFTRLWTFQEAIMAKILVIICGNVNISVFSIAIRMHEMVRQNIPLSNLFSGSGPSITDIRAGKSNRLGGFHDLVQVLIECSKRDCFKLQDKFYGAFGVLGYKDFKVDYDISIEDLNKKIAKYAYSKGDVSWLSIGGDNGAGFIQPMYKPFQYVGYGWKEDPGIRGVRLEGEVMYINAWSFAKVVRHEKVIYNGYLEFRGNVYRTFKSWKFDGKDIVKNIAGFKAMSNDEVEAGEAYLEYCVGNDEGFKTLMTKLGYDATNKRMMESNGKMEVERGTKEVTLIKATTWENKDIPLTIHGNVEVGDRIMLVRMTDSKGRALGIVADEHFRRKGVCVCEKIEMTEEEAISRYTPQEFPL